MTAPISPLKSPDAVSATGLEASDTAVLPFFRDESMAGHSHWAGIKHKKAVVDAKRGKLFSKIARRIIAAARSGGGDPNANLRLKYSIDEAKKANMTTDAIDRAIKKGTGELGGGNFQEVLYEAYGPGGVAILLEIMTDNRNRTAAEIRKILEKRGGSLGESGCAAWMFEKRGLFAIDAKVTTEDRLMEVALDAGAEDVARQGDSYLVTCDPKSFEDLRRRFEETEISFESAELAQVPQNKVPVEGAPAVRKVLSLCEELDEHDDVQNVFANFEIPEEVLREVGGEGG